MTSGESGFGFDESGFGGRQIGLQSLDLLHELGRTLGLRLPEELSLFDVDDGAGRPIGCGLLIGGARTKIEAGTSTDRERKSERSTRLNELSRPTNSQQTKPRIESPELARRSGDTRLLSQPETVVGHGRLGTPTPMCPDPLAGRLSNFLFDRGGDLLDVAPQDFLVIGSSGLQLECGLNL